MAPKSKFEFDCDFVCPQCRSELDLREDALYCHAHGLSATCNGVNGVWRFLDGHPFNSHWENNLTESPPGPKLALARSFLDPLIVDPPPPQSRILDAGCGDGVHASVLDESLQKHNRVKFGVDASIEALNAAVKRTGNQWRFLEADIGQLPFPDVYFDVTYAFGSLEYTDDARQSFAQLCRVLKPGGRLGLWVLSPPEGFTGFALSALRRLSKAGGPLVAHALANLIVPMLPLVANQSGLNLTNATWKQCREAVLVNIASPTLKVFSEEEVRRWFEEENLVVDDTQSNVPGALWGRKPVT